MRRSIIFFDLDGTLADSMAHIARLVTSIAVEDLGIPEALIREQLSHLLSLPAHQAMPELAALAGKDPGVLDEIMRQRPDAVAAPLTLFPETKDVLAELTAAGYTLVLTTNTPAPGLDERLLEAGVLRFFRLVFGTDADAGMSKGPAHINQAAIELDLTLIELAGAAVIVGDQTGDITLGLDFGLPGVGVSRPNGTARERLVEAGALAVIASLRELRDVLQGLDT